MADTLHSMEELEDWVNGIADEVRTRDYRPILTDFLADIDNQNEKFFASGSGPSGPWAPLAPSTVRKKGHAKILIDKGDLEASLTGPHGDAVREIEQIGDKTYLAHGTLDEKAPFHQTGTSRMPQREPVGLIDETIDLLVGKIADDSIRGIQ